MELQSEDGQGLVLESHDQAVFACGGNCEAVGQGLRIDHQRMVAADFDPRGQIGKHQAAAVELDGGAFAVNGDRGVDDPGAEGFADSLVAEANTEQGDSTGKIADHGRHDPRVGRVTRPGGEDDVRRIHRLDVCEGQDIVAVDLEVGVELADHLVDVIGERVEIIEQENHR